MGDPSTSLNEPEGHLNRAEQYAWYPGMHKTLLTEKLCQHFSGEMGVSDKKNSPMGI